MIMPKNAGQSNSITVIQDSYGGLVSNESQGSAAINAKAAVQPKSEQKFRSQTQDAMINRNKNKLQPKTGTSELVSENVSVSKGSARDRTQVNSMKQKAVR